MLAASAAATLTVLGSATVSALRGSGGSAADARVRPTTPPTTHPAPSTTARIQLPASAAPTVTAHPVTVDRWAILLAKAPEGSAQLRAGDGSVVASAPVEASAALLTVPIAGGTRAQLTLEVGDRAVSVSDLDLDNTQAAFEQSPWRVVNKRLALPKTYVPTKLVPTGRGTARPEVASAYAAMTAAARRARFDPVVVSGYRSYSDQVATHHGFDDQLGTASSDSTSARPGHSEHQLGLALDLMGSDGRCELNTCFAGTGLGAWLRANAHQFGFLLRYQKGQQATTGYIFEPWHFRYVGVPLASDYQRRGGQTLEQYFGLSPAPRY